MRKERSFGSFMMDLTARALTIAAAAKAPTGTTTQVGTAVPLVLVIVIGTVGLVIGLVLGPILVPLLRNTRKEKGTAFSEGIRKLKLSLRASYRPSGTDFEHSGEAQVVGPSPASLEPSAKAPEPAEKKWPVRMQRTSSSTSGLSADRGDLGPFCLYAASRIGPSHEDEGIPREDGYAAARIGATDWIAVAVADGLGSTNNSHAAALIASNAAVEHASAQFSRIGELPPPGPEYWHEWSGSMSREIAKRLNPRDIDQLALKLGHQSPLVSAHKGGNPGATTLASGLLGATGAGIRLYWTAIGDCEVAIVPPSGPLKWLTFNESKTGSTISNSTKALPRDYSEYHAGFEELDPRALVLFMTDGAADAVRAAQDQFLRILRTHMHVPPTARVFSELVDFDLPGLNDDRTILAVWARRASLRPKDA